MYRYKIINSKSSSAKLGPCEVCGEYVSDVFHQIEEREFNPGMWTRADCNDLFGHEECLLNARKQ